MEYCYTWIVVKILRPFRQTNFLLPSIISMEARAWENIFEDKVNEKLPDKAVKDIFLYEKELSKDQIVQKKYIMLVKLEDGSGYYKEFPPLEKYDIENYSKQKGEELINKIGRENWSRNTYEGSDHDVWLDQQLK